MKSILSLEYHIAITIYGGSFLSNESPTKITHSKIKVYCGLTMKEFDEADIVYYVGKSSKGMSMLLFHFLMHCFLFALVSKGAPVLSRITLCMVIVKLDTSACHMPGMRYSQEFTIATGGRVLIVKKSLYVALATSLMVVRVPILLIFMR